MFSGSGDHGWRHDARRRPTIPASGRVVVGVDLGQMQDFSALTVVQRVRRDDTQEHHVARTLERLPLGTSYPNVADRVNDVMKALQERSEEEREAGGSGFRSDLMIDNTGVGIAFSDLLRERRLRFTPVTIVGGDRAVAREDGVLSVGKGYLISRLQVILQTGRLHLPETPEASLLIGELRDYQVDFTASGALTFNARSGAHDDLLLSLALATLDLPRKPSTAFAFGSANRTNRNHW